MCFVSIKRRKRTWFDKLAEQNGCISSAIGTEIFKLLFRVQLDGCCCAILRNIEGLGLDNFILVGLSKIKTVKFSSVYRNLFKVWSLFKKSRGSNVASLLVCGSRLDILEFSFAIPERMAII